MGAYTEGSNIILCGLGTWSSVMPKTPHMWRKDLGFKYRQTVESVHYRPLSLGLCDTCREAPRWHDAALRSSSPSSRKQLSRDPWRRGGRNGCWKWWDYSEHAHKQRPENLVERESDAIHSVMIPYIENVPRALEILSLSHSPSALPLVNYLTLENWRIFKSLSPFLIPA